jgi:lon-related putative ATP-dependent protease
MSDLKSKLAINPDRLQYHFDENHLRGLSFDMIEPCSEIIGQDRAMAAVEQGLDIKSKGYNIFVTGHPGTGRTTAVRLLLESIQEKEKPALKDICFVNNFKMPECPRVLYLPAGDGRKFKKAISYLIDSLVTVIPKIFSGENYREKRSRIMGEFESRQKNLFKEFEKKIKEKGFALVQLQIGPVVRPDLQPIIDGAPVSFPELEKAVEGKKFKSEDLERLKREYELLQKELQETSEQSKKISGNLEEELGRLNTSLVVPLINDKIDTLKKVYDDTKVQSYLDELNEALIDMLEIFQPGGDQPSDQSGQRKMRDFFKQFTVNLLVDNSEQKARPIVVEDFPSYKNLFGSVERVFDPATGWHSNFTRIRGGSILKANGGYLVLHALDLFQDPHVWPTLKRVLRTGHLTISNIDVFNFAGGGLRPETIDLDVKVILIGESRIYDVLYHADEDFKKIFKIKAEFDNVMENDANGVARYTEFIKKVVSDEKALPFDKSGLAAMMAHGVRLAGRKDRLSTRFTQIADLIRESAWLAKKNGRKKIDRETVKRAIRIQRERANLAEIKVQEMYERDIFLIDVTGWKVGQINGLSVYDLGDYSFGRPTRITASLSPGADGVINIEREAAMSGRIHDKGVLILSGFMRHRFGRKRPLVFTASLCFEQSYGGVDGDSASSTEVFALLSALSGRPIDQALAMTGSVNQKGEIQPIGGVNEKIEGFFDVCMIDGLTGDQGVIIPVRNVPDLMVKDEVVKAVEAREFHIYAIDHVDEGLELLTGIPAGDMDDEGNFPEGSINFAAAKKLDELAETWRQYLSISRR